MTEPEKPKNESREPGINPYAPPSGPSIRPAAPPQAEKGGFKRGFGTGVGVGLGLMAGFVVLSIVGGLFALISLGMLLSSITKDGASTSLERVWGTEGASGHLRAIRISGTIMTDAADGALLSSGTYGYEVADQLDSLKTDQADGVVLLVNTPGGTITGSKAIADAITRYRERTGKPVLVHVEGSSTSGGVYSTATANEIIADHGSMIGSIGVILGPLPRYKDVVATGSTLLQQGITTTGGISQEYITAGSGKDLNNPYRDLTEQERQRLQAMVDDDYEIFVAEVAAGRKLDPQRIRNEFGAGIFSARQAVNIGLADAVMGRDEFFRHAATAAGLDPDKTVVERVAEPTGLSSLLGAKRAWGTSLPLSALGDKAVASASLCSVTAPIAYAGDLSGVCGNS
ncbi:S49 family peptidase [Arachnia propionica]|jgi:putative protease slr0021|uniref:S49 family peptidase n=1 Tax=Arachnia propionica TaxID=1750 RepID=A0AB37I1J9_9ACTN|nr:S49 family peptidase [Arachnia propionica]AFN45128.1 putative signal peptide peptidase SppA, 36K type [Arachnia propionica F0230a]QCT37637.1 S49 family peptidase [Arachnia propionica]QUC10004.1 S49 family peptidase [Arachnia propionica]QUC15309.1 S49 family peptidase [Arachnia propionica]RPA16926.1 S49 family peptidase [Arachnia propionica]